MTNRSSRLAVIILALALACHWAVGNPLAAQETADGGATAPTALTVQGVAVNGTEGGGIPANRPITLHVIDPLAGRVATAEAVTDERGAFSFEDVTPVAGGSYVLVMDYADMRYNSLLGSTALTEPAEFTVYETTRDIGVVQVERQAMIIADVDEKARLVSVLEVLTVSNGSDRTLLPELTNITNPAEINFLRFSLPAGASQLDVQSNLPGGDVIAIGTGFALTAPVQPGEYQVNYTYRFPYEGSRATFNQRLIQGAQVYQVLAPEELAEIRVAPLQPQPRITIEGKTYLVWESRDIPPRQGITLALSRLPQPGLAARLGQTVADINLWQSAIPITLALALAALLVYAWFRGPRPAPAEGPAGASRPADPQRQALAREVALLDDRFERGQLPEAEYRPRRAELLEQLRAAAMSDSREAADREREP